MTLFFFCVCVGEEREERERSKKTIFERFFSIDFEVRTHETLEVFFVMLDTVNRLCFNEI